MSTLAVAPRLLDGVGGEPTLDDLLAGVWAGLAAHRVVECPVCRGAMEPEYGAYELEPGDSGAAHSGSRTTRARPDQARRDAERAASSSGCHAGRMPEGGRCTSCGTILR